MGFVRLLFLKGEKIKLKKNKKKDSWVIITQRVYAMLCLP
jgi:hypothetical protein